MAVKIESAYGKIFLEANGRKIAHKSFDDLSQEEADFIQIQLEDLLFKLHTRIKE